MGGVLVWLGRRAGKSGKPLLNDRQLAAAELIRADYEKARLGARVTALWEKRADGAPAALPSSPSEQAYAARERVFRALDAVGPELSGIVLEVCCLSAGLEQAERRLKLPARAGKTGRNDPCPCGSGKKFKNCHMKMEAAR